MEKTAETAATSAPDQGSTHRWNQDPEHPKRHIVRMIMNSKAKDPTIAAVADIPPHDLILRFKVAASTIASTVEAPNRANETVATPQKVSHESKMRRRACDIVSWSRLRRRTE
jgi:hypothetical protein